MKPRLLEKYLTEVRPALQEKRKYQNVHQIPRMEKIVVNMGVSASLEKGAVEDAVRDLTQITGRKPIINIARHSIANFKLREGQNIGCRVTLRREVMYEFFDRLVAAALPRIRDFRGLFSRAPSTAGATIPWASPIRPFSRKSNWKKSNATQGMDVTIVTTAPHQRRSAGAAQADGHALRREIRNLLWPRNPG